MGGAERVAINIARSNSQDFQYYLFEVVKGQSPYSNDLKNELKSSNIKYYCSPFKNKKIAICLFGLWFLIKYIKIRPNIIHSHTEIPDLSLWLFRKISWIFFWIHPKYIRTIHNTELWNKWKEIGKIVEKSYIKRNSNIAISKSTQECYTKEYGGLLPPIIYNGLEEVPQKTFPYLKAGKINILFAGRLEYQKGINELIAVVTSLRNNNQLFFHIVGNGSLKNKLNIALKDFPNISIYEKIYGLSHYMGSFDYLFMPSNHEGLALMPIEASLAHTPCIINRCPGLTETLPPNWPLAVNNNSVNDFIKILTECTDKKQYNVLTQEAYIYAKENFSIKKMQQKYERVYTRL